jgi:uncharacterized membrane protein
VAVVQERAVAEDGASLRDLRVFVGGAEESLPVVVDADGRFTISGPVGQALVVRAEATGYESATDTVTPRAAEGGELTLTLHRSLPSGQIRGLVRSMGGRAVDAEVRIEPLGRDLRAEQGRFEVDVAPGTYQVRIAAPGFETQERKVQVEQNGVTLLNVDLRGER